MDISYSSVSCLLNMPSDHNHQFVCGCLSDNCQQLHPVQSRAIFVFHQYFGSVKCFPLNCYPIVMSSFPIDNFAVLAWLVFSISGNSLGWLRVVEESLLGLESIQNQLIAHLFQTGDPYQTPYMTAFEVISKHKNEKKLNHTKESNSAH